MAAPVFITGDKPSAADVDNWMVNTTFAYKTANESVVSSAIVQDDNHLSVSVDASTTYRFEMFMNCTSASATPDLAWRVLGPTGATLTGVSYGGDTTAAASTGPLQVQVIALTSLFSNSARYSPVMVTGVLVTSTTSGTVNLQWGQQTSDPTATVMQTGSYLFLRRLA